MSFWKIFIILVVLTVVIYDMINGFVQLKNYELQTIICDRLSERLGVVVEKHPLNGKQKDEGYDRGKYWYTFNYAGYQYKIKADSIDDYVKEVLWSELHIKIDNND